MKKQITLYGVFLLLLSIYSKFERYLVAKKVKKSTGCIVNHGPLRGMIYDESINYSENIPKYLGSFECELHNIVEDLIKLKFPIVFNVGSAEGYYAVGIALKSPTSRVIAYEIDEKRQMQCINNAKINGVKDRIEVRGRCDSDELAIQKLENALVIMDCEGNELEILAESIVPKLSKSWLLIEIHDVIKPGCSRILFQRLKHSHAMKFISTQNRNPDNYPVLSHLSSRQKAIALCENRLGNQEWMLAVPKSENSLI